MTVYVVNRVLTLYLTRTKLFYLKDIIVFADHTHFFFKKE